MSTSLWLEDKYVNLLSAQLERFSKKDAYTYSFRCPLCGDSAKNKYKTRGYIYKKDDHLNFTCHNCGRGMSAMNFIKELDQRLYDEMRLESIKESGRTPTKRTSTQKKAERPAGERNPLSGLVPLSHFSEDHPIRKYIQARKIPSGQRDRFLYANRFMEWVNTVIPGKFSADQLRRDEPRLVIPFSDAQGNVFAVTGRSFKKDSIKYITIKFDDEIDKIYGLDRIDPSKRVYVFEGPIDSMFIENSIAMAGSSGKLPPFKDSVVILDNEPRNREIVRLNDKLIDSGRRVCIWPKTFKYKDVNDAIMDGMEASEIKSIIDENSFSGLTARIRFNEWKR